MEYSQFLLLFVVLTAIFCQVQSVGFDVGDTRPSCLQSLKNCKRNSTCKEVYKSVKNKCKAKEAQCNARTADLQQCAMDIAYLREAAFPIDNKCICHGKSLSLKKLVRCSEILNTVYANPCFEKGERIRQEAIRIASVTMRAAVATEIDDVTQTPKYDVVSDVALMASTTSAPDTLGENLGEVAADQGDIKSGVRVSDVEKKMESVSEEDMQDVDALFAT
uniref:GDNF/GAS1 domain-containing protein n=2 Tax=Ciona intestinalis TaxID=7719 RepID=F6ZFH4_CIOIN